MKRILGLDLGTNSIGWAEVEYDFYNKEGKITGIGSRIIPMNQGVLDNFGAGQSHSQTADRTTYRGTRRLYQRDNLRRERLHRVLNVLNFLPTHYKYSVDFENKLGQFKKEVKLNYCKDNNGKFQFIFKDSFNEMVEEFKKEQPQLFYTNKKGEETKIPYDWTIYFLRKKALSKKISKEELSWLLLNFNQKRGYYQLRGEEEETEDGKEKTFEVLKTSKVQDSGETIKKSGEKLFEIYFENGWKYDKLTTKPNDWLNKTKEFIVTKSQLKDGTVKRTFKSVDSEIDWIAIKEKTQKDIDASGKTVGTYIYETLLKNPVQKINGKLIKTIERKFYKDELRAILEKQIEFHSELIDKELYAACVEELYKYNQAHKNNILKKAEDKMFLYLFMDDIIFYQRPLKSKKSTISGCQYEARKFKMKTKEGEIKLVSEPLKVISKLNPFFIEFRLWQFLRNLKIYNVDGKNDVDITIQCLQNEEEWCDLFDYLNERKEVEQKNVIDYFIKKKRLAKAEKENYRWNYVLDKKYPMNETRSQIISRLKKVEGVQKGYVLDKATEKNLWYIIYSVKDKNEFKRALKTFAKKNDFDQDSFVSSFEKFPPFKAEYGSLSEKTIKKLLPFMRVGRYWREESLDSGAKERIKLITERIQHLQIPEVEKLKESTLKEAIALVSDDEIPSKFIKSFLMFKGKNPFRGLNTYQACYAIYERHSEAGLVQYWKKPGDIDKFLEGFKQHSLRNPIVEQVVLETLRTVRDIWINNSKKDPEFKFSEIHLELGRDMKNSADKRKKISDRQNENENTNTRIKLLLEELKNDYSEEDIRPFSPSHQEILKIYEEGVYQDPGVSFKEVSEDEIVKIRRNATPTPSEIKRYKLWLEQKYISPYTGEPIPLSKLFSSDYQIEHIIPQSRYFDDSLSNKVICESAINPNPYKDNQTGYEFIKNMGGQIVPELSKNGKTVKLFTLEQYENHCETYFKKNRTKLKNLLSEDIPDGFINRQMNDSRYISKYVKTLLSNIVREDGEKEATAKNLVPISGAITNKLKQDWGLNNTWNKLIESRFQRLNNLTSSSDFGYLDYQKDENGKQKGNEFFRLVAPKGVSKKRIDHRHHALDALVIACATREHIQYLNSLSNENKKHELQSSLMVKNKHGHYTKHFKMPWSSFPTDAKNNLEKTIVSFKKNTRVLTKTNNKYWSYKDEDGNLRLDKNGNPKKELTKQIKGDSRAIRKSLHKETVSGIFNIKTPKGKIATSVRTSLSEIKNQKHIDKISDKRIRDVILPNHLKNYLDEKGNPKFAEAFSQDGIEDLNKNIISLNNGKNHHPILKVKMYEIGSKFSVSENKNSSKNKKFVEAAKGTNLFFGVYWNEEKQKREFDTIPLNIVIERLKQKQSPVLEKYFDKNKIECDLLFYLSPNDLVYVPTEEEIENPDRIDFNNLSKEQVDRVYKMVSSTGNECHFILGHVASLIKKYDPKSKIGEFGSLNKSEVDLEGNRIKLKCLKLKIDRLGNVDNFNRSSSTNS